MIITKDFWAKFKKALFDRVLTVAAIAVLAIVTASFIKAQIVEKHERELNSLIPKVDSLYENYQDYGALGREVDTLHHGVDSLKGVIIKTNETVTRLEEKFDEAKIEDKEENNRFWAFLEKHFGK